MNVYRSSTEKNKGKNSQLYQSYVIDKMQLYTYKLFNAKEIKK